MQKHHHQLTKVLHTLALLFCSGYTAFAGEFSLITMNVQNLFDGDKSGEEYEAYSPPAWTERNYQTRLVAIGKALQSAASNVDVIVLEEVENKKVVDDLHRYYLPAFTYKVVTDNKQSAIEIAVMSKHAIESVHTHALHMKFAHSLRPILDVKIKFPIEKYNVLQVLAVHLKSRRNSKTVSANTIRAYQYELLAKVIDNSMPTVIAGDFNDFKPHNALSRYGVFVVRPPTKNFKNAKDYNGDVIDGTYYYRHAWYHLDHVLLDTLFKKITNKVESIILSRKPFINSKGLPNRAYKGNKSGVSDHLPVLFLAQW